jgi:hypothetical protein
MPALEASTGPMPKAARRPIAPGRFATHSVTTIIQSIPMPISHQKKPSRPKGIAASPNSPAGITSAETTGIAARLASTP